MTEKIKVFDTEFKDCNKNILLPQHPAKILIAGPSGSGKTNLLLNLIMNKDAPWKAIYLFYAVEQEKYNILDEYCKKHKIFFEKFKGLPPPSFEKVIENKELLEIPKLVILDDIMMESDKSNDITKLFTLGSHHKNLTVISLIQKIFVNKTQRLNTDYVFLFNFCTDLTTIRNLFMQLEPTRFKPLLESYEQTMKESPHAFFLCDLKCHRLNPPLYHLKYRGNAFDNILEFKEEEEEASKNKNKK